MEKAAHYWSIGKVARYLGVSVVTLRRWDKEGRLSSDSRTFGKHRRYDAFRIQRLFQKEKPKATVGYARVSSHDQKNDLERQANTLKQHYPNATIIKDLGNGLNFNKKGLKTLLAMIVNQEIETLVLTHKDRLLRFGSELMFKLCQHFGIQIVILNQQTEQSFEETLSQDVIELMTVFCARLYGARSHKNRQVSA
jgi:predicted site-specific integrase-resolvase